MADTVYATGATVKPSGLTIARNDNLKFAVSWKISDKDYGDGQQMEWRAWHGENNNATAWTAVSTSASATKKTVTITIGNYYPATNKKLHLYWFEFRVRGKRQQSSETKNNVTTVTTYTWSDWSSKKWRIGDPKEPTVSAEVDSTNWNKTTFTYAVSTSTTDNHPFVDTQWESMLVPNCNETDGSKLKWKSGTNDYETGTGTASGSKYFTDDFSVASKTRWFRIRSRGPGAAGSVAGCSSYVYAKHVYAIPYKATITSAKSTATSTVTTVTMAWTVKSDASHPIDVTKVQYVIATPATGFTCPSGASWQDAGSYADTTGKDSAKFRIDNVVGADQCLWVRVVTQHDNNMTYSDPFFVEKGKLTAPTNLSVSTNTTTWKATITATNNSTVPDSELAVVFRASGLKDNYLVGFIPHGSNSITVTLVNWSSWGNISFAVYAFQGTKTAKTSKYGFTMYSTKANMKSDQLKDGGNVPVAPDGVSAQRSETPGEVIVNWSWTWTDANQCELSWSQNPNAWESTEEPSKYIVDNTNAAKWRVSGLETGVRWYFAARFINQVGDSATYGPYSDPVYVDLSSAPAKPVVLLSQSIIPNTEKVTVSWEYESTDGTKQVYAEIAEYANNTYTRIISCKTSHYANMKCSRFATGTTHLICVQVTSESGFVSEWSDPVALIIADAMTCTISSTSLTSETISYGGTNRTVNSLKAMPFTATITGAGSSGITSLVIERADDYRMRRPDESVFDGYDGETIASYTQYGESQISIGMSDLVGRLDDGAPYRLIATTQDSYGQSATAEPLLFEVHWTHQAGIPTATVTTSGDIAVITPTAPSGYVSGDVCDIYRLSAGAPTLIVEGGAFGSSYKDPYPTLGPHGGYRVVCRTANGDYITSSDTPAWVDVEDELFNNKVGIVSFNGIDIPLKYNVALSNSWKKDFKETKYLGGTVTGDWNLAVSRTGSINVVVDTSDLAMVEAVRQLADYSGICHIRLQDGSNFTADVQVSGNTGYSVAGKIETVTLNYTRVKPEVLDGLPA